MQPPDAGHSDGPVEAPRESSSRRVPKKRTKTGCLTCRKRRIKCGEEKPICSNCVKSKRICEGYAQRVIFKNPMGIFGAYGPPQSQDFQVHQQMRIPLFNEPLPAQQAAAAAQHPMLAPRPVDMPPNLGYQDTMPSSETSPPESKSAPLNAPQFYYPTLPVHTPPQPWPSHTAEQSQSGSNHQEPTTYAQDQNQSQPQQPSYPQTAQSTETLGIEHHPQQPVVGWETFPTSQDYAAQYAAQLASESAANNRSQEHPLFPRQASTYQYPQQVGQMTPGLTTSEPFVRQPRGQASYMDEELEDFYDVESDDEMIDQAQSEGFNQLTLIMASANHDSQLRSFRSHLNEPNILANYRPSLGSSPLNNPKTARIFAHFIHSTGPCLSIFERHPTDSSIVLGVQVPPAQQGLWTYTLPLKALEHPALLQAILAVSSLHIASLQGVPSTVSLKHYHYALKRIGRAVSLPMRRKQIGTLAATQLLAYYEVISADHSKWNSHVAGAAQLIKEIDYAGTTRDLRAYRRQIQEQRQQMQWSTPQMYPFGFENDDEDDPFAEKETSIDEGFLSTVLGRAVNYDEFGSVEDGQPQSPKKFFSRKDIENIRHQSDLHWWFNKQDVLHSMISGEKLFVPFFMKGQCPPRAGMGRLDAIYGSSDHLWLLLSRITDFGYRDRKRKLRALRIAGTEWKPGPNMFKFMGRFARGNPSKGPGPPGRPPGPPQSSSSTSSQSNPGSGPSSGPTSVSPPDSTQRGPPSRPPAPEGRPMYGMIPPKPPTRLPSGFVDPRQDQRESSEELDENEFSSHREVEDKYKEAEQEWEQILIAVDAFANALGRDFQPLPVDVMPAISTPFGPALQYRTHTIAVVWGFYYAARILLNRFHPSMPPAMMVAAGVAAPTTAEYAQSIGRITAGIYYPQRYNLQAGSLSPTLGSSLTEMTVPVFFAGVQYTDPVQRIWTIAKLRDVSRLTGWKTSDAIAGGCEKAWIVAAKIGRGPPYERSFELPADRDAEDVLHRREAQQSEDRRFVTVELNDRASRGMGLLSLEGDMQNLEV